MKNVLNIAASLLAFAVNIVISFVLSPIIVNSLGEGAFGYVTLTNNLAYYFSIVGVTVNSMGVRFVTISAHGKEQNDTQLYYNTVFIFDCIVGAFLVFCGIFLAMNANAIFEISPELYADVQKTFILAFLGGAIGVITPIFNSGVYIKNRIDILYAATILACFIRLIITIVLFSVFPVKIYFIAVASIFSNLVSGIIMFIYTKFKTPVLKTSLRIFSLGKLLEIAKSGIWVTVENIATILITGLGLVYANIFVGENQMGLLSIAQTIPVQFQSIANYIVQPFVPQLLYYYSQSMKDKLLERCLLIQRISSYIILVPVCGIIAFGRDFYSLWIPSRTSEEIMVVQILSIIVVIPYLFAGCFQIMNQVNIIFNKVKKPAIISGAIGVFGTLFTVILGSMGMLNVYYIAVITSIIFLVNGIWARIVCAVKSARVDWKPVMKSIVWVNLYSIVLICIFKAVEIRISINSWKEFIFVIGICGCMGYIVPGIDLIRSGLLTEREK